MFGLPKYGPGIGFRRLLAYCDQEHIDLESIGRSSIVITGSNGKGSTARFVYECLHANGKRVGCFISPHLYSIHERFEIAGARIDDDTLNEYVRRVVAFDEQLQRRQDRLGAFEALFLIALSWFHDREVECSVWEAGIGGRYDPVRVLRSPLSALTSVDLEHTELLGATRQLIAFDKLDSTRAGGRTFISPAVDADLTPDLEAFARLTDRSLVFVPPGAIADVAAAPEGTRFTLTLPGRPDRIDATIPLPGMHQVHNAATALHLVDDFLKEWDLAASLQAITRMQWPGRLEKIHADPEVWIDVGHTPEAVARTCATLASMFDPDELLVVFGVSANKAVSEIAGIVGRHFRHVLLTQAYKLGSDAQRLAAEYFDDAQTVAIATTMEEAVARSLSIATERGWKIAVVGGLFLSIEFAHTLGGGDPRALDFF